MNMKWLERFRDLAVQISTWSKDPSRQVGAVIVDAERRVVGMGYNGFPRGVSDDPARYEEKSVKLRMVVHAEANAILNARGSVSGCSMIVTSFPCSECAKLIIQSGVDCVHSTMPADSGKWADDAEFSRQMLREADVHVVCDVVLRPDFARYSELLNMLAAALSDEQDPRCIPLMADRHAPSCACRTPDIVVASKLMAELQGRGIVRRTSM